MKKDYYTTSSNDILNPASDKLGKNGQNNIGSHIK